MHDIVTGLGPLSEDGLLLLALLHTRIRGPEALESEGRISLLSVVRDAPGIHLRELQRRTGFGWGRLHYHVRLLCRTSALRQDRQGRRLRLYLAGSGKPEEERMPAVALRLYGLVSSGHGGSSAELATSAGISRQLARYHLKRLVERKMLRVLAGRPERYVVGDHGRLPGG